MAVLPVAVFGTVVIDRIRFIDRLPGPGQFCEYKREQRFVGGEAANTAILLKSLGHEVWLAGNSLGSGDEADWLKHELRSRSVDPDHCDPHEDTVPSCEIYVTPDGERTMFGRGWESRSFLLPDGYEWFTADPNRGACARDAIREADIHGAKLYLMDFIQPTDPIPQGSWHQTSTDWVGTRGDTETNAAWAEALSLDHGCVSIVTDGAFPMVVAKGGRSVRIEQFMADTVVDATGAGDCFRAFMLDGLIRGNPIEETVLNAMAAASISIQTIGAAQAVPTREQIEKIKHAQNARADNVCSLVRSLFTG